MQKIIIIRHLPALAGLRFFCCCSSLLSPLLSANAKEAGEWKCHRSPAGPISTVLLTGTGNLSLAFWRRGPGKRLQSLYQSPCLALALSPCLSAVGFPCVKEGENNIVPDWEGEVSQREMKEARLAPLLAACFSCLEEKFQMATMKEMPLGCTYCTSPLTPDVGLLMDTYYRSPFCGAEVWICRHVCCKTCVSMCAWALMATRQSGKGKAMHSWSLMLPWAYLLHHRPSAVLLCFFH